MGDRCVLIVKYTPVTPRVRTAVAGFLKYVQHRDQHPVQPAPDVPGLLKYVAHRDQSATKGRLFGPEGTVGDLERKQLTGFIAESVKNSRPQLTRDAKGNLVDRRRAAYRFILSPERAEGLDLRQLTRAALQQLEQDAGGLGPWIAAEHRNTAHPHVHIILAARREIEPGRYRGVNLTRERLARMKLAVERELDRQRGRTVGPELPRLVSRSRFRAPDRAARKRAASAPLPRLRRYHRPAYSFAALQLRRLAQQYRREAEREAERRLREREWENER